MVPVSKWLLAFTGARAFAGVAMVGGFLRHLLAARARDGCDGRHAAGDGASDGATTPPGSSIAALYAANTFGAVVGVLAAAFWLVPQFGLVRTAVVCAVLNLLCAQRR